MSYAVSVAEGESEMLQTQTVVEQFVKRGLLKLFLIAEFNLEHVSLIYISKADHILAQINDF